MNKEEFLEIQTTVLKVKIHYPGCEKKVKRVLFGIDGVYMSQTDREHGRVTVWGNVGATELAKRLSKEGKPTEVWAPEEPPNSKPNDAEDGIPGGEGSKVDQPPNGQGSAPQATPQGTPEQLLELLELQQMTTPQRNPQGQRLKLHQHLLQFLRLLCSLVSHLLQKLQHLTQQRVQHLNDFEADEGVPVQVNEAKQAGHVPLGESRIFQLRATLRRKAGTMVGISETLAVQSEGTIRT